MNVTPVKPEDLNEKELALIVSYCRKCFEPVSFEDIAQRVCSGDAVIYRYEGPATGIFILSRGDNGLYIETVAGAGAVKYFDEIYKKIRMVATAAGARNLYSFVSRPALHRLYERRTQAQEIATLYREALR